MRGFHELDDDHAYCFIERIQRLHDFRLIRAVKVPRHAGLDTGPGRLGNRLLRILFCGAREPLWLSGLFGSAAQDDPGRRHSASVCRFLDLLPGRVAAMESRCRVCVSGGRCVLLVREVSKI